MATATKRVHNREWGPYFKKILGPNVPWAWYIANTVISMVTTNLFVGLYEMQGQIMAGDIYNNPLLFKYVGLSFLSLLLTTAISYSKICADLCTERRIQSSLWTKMIYMPMGLYDQQGPSSLISRVTNDTMQITSAFGYIFSLVEFVYILGLVLFKTWELSHKIALTLLLVVPYIILTMIIPGQFMFKANKAAQQKLADFTTFVAERLSAITLVKSSANEEGDIQVGYAAAEDCYKATVKAYLINAASQPFTYCTDGIVTAVIIISGSLLVAQGELAQEELMTMYMYGSQIYSSMIQFIFCFHGLKESQGATSKIAQIMDAPSEVMERQESFTQPDDDIVLDNVTFGYGQQNVLKNVSFTIPKGKVTAIVGPSGAGKTTILSLLERLYTPKGGQIKFGGAPVETIHLDQWRDATGYIQQASPLRSGTIRENIAYGLNRPVRDGEVERAAKLANAYDFIMELPDGFDTDIGMLGGKLSGGQRQRIAIARMIIKNPDYLLLDEATSNLDAENEAAVQSALSQIMAGKTAVVVAHNLRTVVNADQIVVLDQGRVQATGTHEKLYKTNALYKKYFDLQFAE